MHEDRLNSLVLIRGGGILWRYLAYLERHDIFVTLRYAHKSFLQAAAVSACEKASDLLAVYASPNPIIRRFLWPKLNALRTCSPRLLIEDFNYVLRGDERSYGGGVSTSFIDWVDSNRLVDLGFSGPTFTWNHGVNIMT